MELILLAVPVTDELEIDIRRKFVLQDALREGRKKKFCTNKSLKVKWQCACNNTCLCNHPDKPLFIQVCFVGEGAVGEGAVDTGGPRREFFRLLAEQVRESVYFQCGKDSAGSFFACNTSGYRVKTFLAP